MAGRRIAQLVVGIMLGSGIVIPIALLLIAAPAASERRDARAAARTLAAARPASCQERLLKDWRDGHINNIYPIDCYRKAIKDLPTDLLVYSSAAEDIRQALSERIALRARKA
jgi:hypothetical protein